MQKCPPVSAWLGLAICFLQAGPLEAFVNNPDITEIMVNGPDKIFVEENGVIKRTTENFKSEAELRLLIDRLEVELVRRVDISSPTCAARLSDG